MTDHPLILPLPRPEYPAAPELLLASLAWRHFSLPDLEETGGKPIALTYRPDTQRMSSRLTFRSTEPTEAQMLDWENSLRSAGLDWTNGQTGLVGRSVAESILGIRTTKARGQAAIPMTPRLALLQNARGMTGKQNPANYGLVIEQLYAQGNGVGPSATAQWLNAVDLRMKTDPLLSAIDSACEALLSGPLEQRLPDQIRRTLDLGPDTPFAWFAKSWDRLASPEWVQALPARRWTDWATTVIRLGVGMGYLWEASWYEALARLVRDGPDKVNQQRERTTVWGELVDRHLQDLVPWHDDAESVSVRNVAPVIKERIRRGTSLRAAFAEILPAHPCEDPWEDLLQIAQDEDSIERLNVAFERRNEPNPNTMETVRYVLMTREESGPHADHYGLLIAPNNRYLVVQPATELLAMCASLAAPGPISEGDSHVSLAEVAKELGRLGLQPSTGTLIAHLERTGLARGSADADQAVLVSSAY